MICAPPQVLEIFISRLFGKVVKGESDGTCSYYGSHVGISTIYSPYPFFVDPSVISEPIQLRFGETEPVDEDVFISPLYSTSV